MDSPFSFTKKQGVPVGTPFGLIFDCQAAVHEEAAEGFQPAGDILAESRNRIGTIDLDIGIGRAVTATAENMRHKIHIPIIQLLCQHNADGGFCLRVQVQGGGGDALRQPHTNAQNHSLPFAYGRHGGIKQLQLFVQHSVKNLVTQSELMLKVRWQQLLEDLDLIKYLIQTLVQTLQLWKKHMNS